MLFPVGTALFGLILRNRLGRQHMFDKLSLTTRRLNDTQSLTRVGGREWDVEKQSIFWTDEVYCIHRMNPGEFPQRSKVWID